MSPLPWTNPDGPENIPTVVHSNHELVSFQTAQDCNAKVHLSCVAREAQVTVEDCSETGDSANWLSSWRYPDENIYIIYTVHICK